MVTVRGGFGERVSLRGCPTPLSLLTRLEPGCHTTGIEVTRQNVLLTGLMTAGRGPGPGHGRGLLLRLPPLQHGGQEARPGRAAPAPIQHNCRILLVGIYMMPKIKFTHLS